MLLFFFNGTSGILSWKRSNLIVWYSYKYTCLLSEWAEEITNLIQYAWHRARARRRFIQHRNFVHWLASWKQLSTHLTSTSVLHVTFTFLFVFRLNSLLVSGRFASRNRLVLNFGQSQFSYLEANPLQVLAPYVTHRRERWFWTSLIINHWVWDLSPKRFKECIIICIKMPSVHLQLKSVCLGSSCSLPAHSKPFFLRQDITVLYDLNSFS